MYSAQIDVREIIDRNPLRPIQYWILAICMLIAIIDGFDTAVVGVTGPALIAQGLVDPKSFGYVLSAGIIGFVPGMLTFGPAADKWGPKSILIVGVLVFAAGSLMTALSTHFNELIVGRLITGVGLGGASPCFVALAADYSPQRLRTTIVTLLWAGVPGGGILGGVLAARYLSTMGWHALFYFGTAAPIVAAALLIFTVPESLGYMLLRGGRDRKILAILSRVDSSVAADQVSFVAPRNDSNQAPIKALFEGDRARITLSLWVAFFCAFGQTTMISQYTSVLLKLSGMASSHIGTVFSFFYVGSVVGTIAAGPIMKWLGYKRATVYLLLLSAIGSVLFGFLMGDYVFTVIGITLAGFTAAAAIGALIALTAELYPLSIRATGLGWSLAMSRAGSASGPLLSGILVSWNLTHTSYYSVVGSIALIGAAAILNIQYAKHSRDVMDSSTPLSKSTH